MSITARKFIISLLIVAQGLILWQGVFASGFSQVDSENTPCIQHDMTQQDVQTQNNEMDCDCCNQMDCLGCCYSCVHCSFGLISSVPTLSFSPLVLNSTFFISILDGHSAQLFKPPRKFFSRIKFFLQKTLSSKADFLI